MNSYSSIFIIVAIVLIVVSAILIALYFLGRKLEKQQVEQQSAIEAAKQTITMLVIDKKKLKIKESGLPRLVYEQTPWYLKLSKVPIVKAKVGPKIMTLMADEKVYQSLPLKSEVKVVVSGIYISAIKSVRGGTIIKPVKKKGWLARLFKK